MAKIPHITLIFTSLLVGCVTAPATNWLYFNDLATKSLAGDGSAFREVLDRAQTTPPGEKLEELAEISSRYIHIDPADFLRAQSTHTGCFGVDFMGPKYVDNSDASIQENTARFRTLDAVSDTTLEEIKQLCLAVLDGP